MKALIGDIRFALRLVVENTGNIALAAMALALSIGVNFAISGNSNRIFLRSDMIKASSMNPPGVQSVELSLDSDYRFLFGRNNNSCIILTRFRSPGWNS